MFDVGETLVDETRAWGEWADWMGVPRFTFFGALGGVIERGWDHRRVFDVLRPGYDVAGERELKEAAGLGWRVEARDLYPDAVPCLVELRRRGYRLGVAGNQTIQEASRIRKLALPVDFVFSSGDCGVEKPSAGFFSGVCDASGAAPSEVAYVGDRVDNDMLPALEAGMVAVFLRRGPWGVLHAADSDVARAHIHLDSLEALPEALGHPGTGP